MTARTHDLAAVTALTVTMLWLHTSQTITLATLLVALVANLIGGITPDIDQPTAPLWRNLPVGGFVGRVFDKMLGGHRFITHSILGVAIFGFGAHWLLIFLRPVMHSVNVSLVWDAYMIGMLSHLVMDTFTKEGVPWLLPIPVKFGLPPLKSLRITTGKAVEKLVVFPALLIFNIWLFASHYQLIRLLLHNHVI